MEGLDRIYKKNENFVFRKIEGETILVPIKDNVGDMGSIYNLNYVGAFVWEQVDGAKSLQDIKNRLLEEYEVSFRETEDDLLEYIAQLKEIDAVTRTEWYPNPDKPELTIENWIIIDPELYQCLKLKRKITANPQ